MTELRMCREESASLVDVLVIVLSRFLTFLIDLARFFFILEIRHESFLDFTARILTDFQEYKILDRTDKSCPASQDWVYMILDWQTRFVYSIQNLATVLNKNLERTMTRTSTSAMDGRIMAQPTHGPLMYLKFFSEIVYRDTLVQVIYHHELFFCLTN
jgi:hypothetical protein